MATKQTAPRSAAGGRREEGGITVLCRSVETLVQQAERDWWDRYRAGDRAGRYGFQAPVWGFTQGWPLVRATLGRAGFRAWCVWCGEQHWYPGEVGRVVVACEHRDTNQMMVDVRAPVILIGPYLPTREDR